MNSWITVRDRLPPECMVVETKIDDANGCRNQQCLVWDRNLWWTKDMEMYVYYCPTHWRFID